MKHYKSVEFVNFYKCQAPFTEVKNKSFWWRFWLYESWPESETASLCPGHVVVAMLLPKTNSAG